MSGLHFNNGVYRNMKSILTKHQVKTFQKQIKYDGKKCLMTVTIRYDDECGNGHNTFAITGVIKQLDKRLQDNTLCCGCIHNAIEKYFPEFKHLIKWHLYNSDGPMYYLENTLYLASDSADSKYKVGEPNRWKKVLVFNDSYITHKFPKEFIEFLENKKDKTYHIVEVEHKKGSDYNYKPKYTFEGFECQWYQCPFDDKQTAEEYQKELTEKQWEIKTIVTGYQEAKLRDFAAARRSAIWPDATDEQLSLPREELKKLLIKRLPRLMKEFKKDIEALGFIY